MKKILTILLFGALAAVTVNAQTRRYVKTEANGGAAPSGSTSADALNATSWAAASSDLQAVINVSSAGDEIWVAAGTYKPIYTASGYNSIAATPVYPNTNGTRYNSFVLKSGVKIYGGFAGTEISLAQRNLAANKSILSGDIGTVNNRNDNCYHVVISAGAVGEARLDGFSIIHGLTSYDVNHSIDYTYSVTNGQSVFLSSGGGIYLINSAPNLVNLEIRGNEAYNEGGGIYSNNSSPKLTNVLVCGNAGYLASGIFHINTGVLTLTNVTVSGNYDDGIYIVNGQMKLYNTIIWGNRIIVNSSASATYTHCLIQGLNPSGTGNLDGTGIKSLSISNFINYQEAVYRRPTIEGDYRLQACSPCVDRGNDSIYLAHVGALNFDNQTDVAGINRRHGLSIDMGAYEFDGSAYPYTPDANGKLYVNKSVSGSNGSGSSWANAIPELATALMAARHDPGIKEIWVAAGIYKPLYHASAPAGCIDGGRDNAFVLVAGVKIYGGFAGIETNLAQRNLAANKSILSGDIGTEDDHTDNCYHVVISAGEVGDARLDGFSIIHGRADGSSTVTVNGQSFYRDDGGGISLINSAPNLVYLEIRGNRTTDRGGGIFAQLSSPKLTNVLVSGNVASSGGGIYHINTGVLTLTNVTISGNSSTTSSGIHIDNAQMKGYNTIVWGNTNGISGSGATYTNCLIQGLNPAGTGNLDGTLVTDLNIPNFINPQKATSGAPTIEGDFRLEACSPCVDKGSDSIYLAHVGASNFDNQTDAAGINRRHGLSIDMGAYEFDGIAYYNPDAQGRLYVNKSVSGGTGKGSSWANAMPELATALMAAHNDSAINEIWVAAGTYKPLYHASAISCADGGRNNAFVLVPGVKIYGGFAGIETNLAQRNLAANKSILSGDIGTEDVHTDNSYHVVVSAGSVISGTDTARLDGFSIIHGRADGSSMVTVNGQSFYRDDGGGISLINSAPNLVYLEIRGNRTTDRGGGIFAQLSSPKLTNVLVSGNVASSGGGIYNYNASVLTLTNVTISGNYGYGIYSSSSQMKAYNTIVWGNTNGISGSGATYTNCLIQGQNPAGTGNLDGTLVTSLNIPNFINPVLATSGSPTIEGDFRLEACSPCVDKGSDSIYLAHVGASNFDNQTDAAGIARRHGLSIDMGAYEFDGFEYTPDANGRLYVNKSVSGGTGNGSSWDNAMPELATALIFARTHAEVNEIWVASGTYKPLYHASAIGCADGGRDNAFVLVAGVKIYGGFAGTETSLAQRNLAANKCILSGDIGTEDVDTDNCYHVVIVAGSMISGADTARLDGFSIIHGNADGGSSTLTVNGQSVSRRNGGGISLTYSSPNLVYLEIRGNNAYYGGGLYAGNSSPKLTNVLVCGNRANYGGGIYVGGSAGVPTLTNVTVSGNYVSTNTNGSGIYIYNCQLKAYNTIVWGNTVATDTNGSATYTNCLISGLNPEGTGNLDGTLVTGINIPTFINPQAATSSSPTIEGDFRLEACSPCVDRGNDSIYLEHVGIADFTNQTDVAGIARRHGLRIDMGAYEFDGFEYTPDANGRLYVNKSVSGGNSNGSSWDNAMPELATALIFARTHAEVNEIWVASGTYKPLYHASAIGCADGGRDNAFVLVPGVKVYGGFAGTETSLAQRNLAANKCILSGDIGTEDVDTDNSYHIVISAGDVGDARLDGFSIIHGRATGSSTVTVNGHSINMYGAGIHIVNSSPDLVNLEIRGNMTASNSNDHGGGICINGSSPKLTNVLVSGNAAGGSGGGIYFLGGGISTFTNVTVSGNATPNGSGIYINSGQMNAYNSIVWGNSTVVAAGSSATYTYCLIDGLNPAGTGNLNGIEANNPLFVNPQSATVYIPTIEGDFQLEACSPCVNQGYNATYLTNAGIADFNGEKDVAGNPRLSGSAIDMGAYEFDNSAEISVSPDANGRVYVTVSGAGNKDGSSWANAYPGLADPLLAAQSKACTEIKKIKEIWVARGRYLPLHKAGNGTSDKDKAFVIAAGVRIYGGFAGTETLLSERNLAQNPSILSGDNSYHTVISAGSMISGTDTARLDGFVVRNGKAKGSGTITVNGQSISANSGGGIYFANSSPNIVNVEIKGSEASAYGGGIYAYNSSPKLINAVVSGNLSASGGGIYLNGGSPALTNITVSGNRATTSGGGIYTNNSSPQIGNSIVWGNAAGSSNNVYSAGGSPAYQYSLIQDLNPSGAGNINGTNPSNAPAFMHPVSASAAPSIDGYYRPQLGSPALNAGNNALNREPTDIESAPRIQESQIELGAYEVNYNFECNCE